MQGAVQMGNIVERAELAINAGCDMVLVCNDPMGAVKVIDDLPSGMNLHKISIDRIKRLKKTTSLDFSNLRKTSEYQIASKVLDQFYAN